MGCAMWSSAGVRRLVAASALGMVLVLSGGSGPALGAPPSVDNVVATIGANIAAGKWRLAEQNIAALDATIRDELKVKKNAVAVASNPVQERLDAVQQRLQLIKADYKVLYDARTRIDRASARQARVLVGQVGIELVQKLNLINARNAIDALDALDTDGAQEIAASAQRLRTQDRAVRYLSRLIDDLRPAIREAQAERARLADLNRRFTAVLSSYGLSAGGAPAEPTAGAHPRIGGRWVESTGSCSGAVITYTQAAGGEVTAATDDLPSCSAAWVASNIRWVSQNVLAYDYTVTKRPQGWSDGSHRVTFAPDGRTATMQWTDRAGATGSVSLVRQG